MSPGIEDTDSWFHLTRDGAKQDISQLLAELTKYEQVVWVCEELPGERVHDSAGRLFNPPQWFTVQTAYPNSIVGQKIALQGLLRTPGIVEWDKTALVLFPDTPYDKTVDAICVRLMQLGAKMYEYPEIDPYHFHLIRRFAVTGV